MCLAPGHSRRMKNTPSNLLVLIAGLAFCALAPAKAQVLMFDFGSTTVAGSDQSNSPYHTVNPSFTGTSWNKVTTGGGFNQGLGSLLYADGTAATGVLAYRGTGATTIDFQGNMGGDSTGGADGTVGGTILAGTSVGRDGLYSSNNTKVGLRVQGLAIGTYDVYVVGWLTSVNDPRDFWAESTLSGQTGGSRNWTIGATAQSVTNSITLDTSAWTQGANYVKFTVTTTASLPAISIASGVGAAIGGQPRAMLNAIQIVAVPEPSAAVIIMSSGLCMLILRRQRAVRA